MTAQPDNTIDEQGDSKSPQLGEQPEQVKSITQARLLPNLAHKLTKKMNDDENNRVVDMAQSTIDDELTAKEILEYFWVDTCKATHNVDSPKFKYRVKKYETLITNLIAQEANKAYGRGYNTGWQKANRKHKRVWRQINDLSTIDGIGELEGEAQ